METHPPPPKRLQIQLPVSTTTTTAAHPPGSGSAPVAVMNTTFNPLLMEDVLENVFKYCDKESLNNSRLVNKFWHQTSLPAWRKHVGPIVLWGGQEKDSEATAFRRRHDSPSVQRFINEVHHFPSSSPSSFEYCGLRRAPSFGICSLDAGAHSCAPKSFGIFCGPWVTSLTLLDFTCRDLALFRDILCSRFTPRLEKLVIEVAFNLDPNSVTAIVNDGMYKENKHFKSCCIEIDGQRPGEESRGNDFTFDWDKILGLYPNLEYLGLCHGTRKIQGEFAKILAAILKIREQDPSNLESLKSIDLLIEDGPFRIVDGAGLSQSQSVVPLLQHPLMLRFSSLGLRFDEGTEQEGIILASLLASQNSLKELTFYCPSNFPNLPSLGISTSLETLTIYGFPFSNLTFLKSFPSLRSLELARPFVFHGFDPDDDDDEIHEGADIVRNTKARDMFPLPSITEFSCNYNFGNRNPGVHRLSMWMPNIKILKMHLNGPMFADVCKHFPNLEELVVWGDTFHT